MSTANILHLQVPATTANMGPGFDTFGLALSLYNEFSFEFGGNSLNLLTSITEDRLTVSPHSTVSLGKNLPTSPEDTLPFQVLKRLWQETSSSPRPPCHLEMTIHIPLARGLGSSASVVAAALMASNAFLGNPYTCEGLTHLASDLEGHPDNVIPALLGGAYLCDAQQHYSLPWPKDWGVVVVIPPYPVSTEAARKVLPKTVSHADAVFNLRKSALLTYALCQSDADAFAHALDDQLHQPFRSPLIPEFHQVSQTAKAAGAFGTTISGSGSTLCTFTPLAQQAEVQTALENFLSTISSQPDPFQILSLQAELSGSRILTPSPP